MIRSGAPEEFKYFLEGAWAGFGHGFVAPINPIRDLQFGLQMALWDSDQVKSVLGIVDWVDFSTWLIPDFESFSVQVDALDHKLVIVMTEKEVHFGDGLILCAEE